MAGRLDDRRLEEGKRLLASLADRGIEVYAALWAFRPVLGEWRLVIATPHVERIGPRAVISTVDDEVAKANGQLSFDAFDVEVVNPQNPALTELMDVVGLHGRMENVTIEDHIVSQNGRRMNIESVYIYLADERKIFPSEDKVNRIPSKEP